MDVRYAWNGNKQPAQRLTTSTPSSTREALGSGNARINSYPHDGLRVKSPSLVSGAAAPTPQALAAGRRHPRKCDVADDAHDLAAVAEVTSDDGSMSGEYDLINQYRQWQLSCANWRGGSAYPPTGMQAASSNAQAWPLQYDQWHHSRDSHHDADWESKWRDLDGTMWRRRNS